MPVSTPPSRSVPPPGDTATAPPPERVRRWYRRPAYLALLVLLVLTLVVVSVVLASGGDQERQVSPNPYQVAYGTFEPITRSGRGDALVALPRETDAGILTMKVSSGWFDVEGRAANFFDLNSLIGWTGGTAPYRGRTAFGLSDPDFGLKYLDVAADPDASWTLTVQPISSAPELPAAASGTGNAIYRYSGDASEWLFEHPGSGYFWVGQQLLLEAVGTQPLTVQMGKRHRGTATAMAGPSVVIITSEGEWSINVR